MSQVVGISDVNSILNKLPAISEQDTRPMWTEPQVGGIIAQAMHVQSSRGGATMQMQSAPLHSLESGLRLSRRPQL